MWSEDIFNYAKNNFKADYFDWTVYANHALVECDKKIGLSWLDKKDNFYQKGFLERLFKNFKNKDALDLLKGFFMNDEMFFSLALAAASLYEVNKSSWGREGGQSIEGFMKLRNKSPAVIVEGDARLNPLLKCSMNVDAIYVKTMKKEAEVSDWALGLLTHQAKTIWISFETLRDMPYDFAKKILSRYDEIILGPRPYPYIPEVYKKWEVSYVVCDYCWDFDYLMSWIKHGGHAMDSNVYELKVHSVI